MRYYYRVFCSGKSCHCMRRISPVEGKWQITEYEDTEATHGGHTHEWYSRANIDWQHLRVVHSLDKLKRLSPVAMGHAIPQVNHDKLASALHNMRRADAAGPENNVESIAMYLNTLQEPNTDGVYCIAKVQFTFFLKKICVG